MADQPNFWEAYSTNLFTARACDIIRTHHSTTNDAGLFLYLAYQGVHEPRQSPEHYYDQYNATIADMERRQFAGMLSALDEGLANVTAALKESATMYVSAVPHSARDLAFTFRYDGLTDNALQVRRCTIHCHY